MRLLRGSPTITPFAQHGPRGRESKSNPHGTGRVRARNPVAQTLGAAILSRLDEAFHEAATVGFDHPLRWNVVRVGRQFDIGQTFGPSVRQERTQRAGRITAPALPGTTE